MSHLSPNAIFISLHRHTGVVFVIMEMIRGVDSTSYLLSLILHLTSQRCDWKQWVQIISFYRLKCLFYFVLLTVEIRNFHLTTSH